MTTGIGYGLRWNVSKTPLTTEMGDAGSTMYDHYRRRWIFFARPIDNQISRLRKKIEIDPKNPALIKTVWGGGYTLSAEVRKL